MMLSGGILRIGAVPVSGTAQDSEARWFWATETSRKKRVAVSRWKRDRQFHPVQ